MDLMKSPPKIKSRKKLDIKMLNVARHGASVYDKNTIVKVCGTRFPTYVLKKLLFQVFDVYMSGSGLQKNERRRPN